MHVVTVADRLLPVDSVRKERGPYMKLFREAFIALAPLMTAEEETLHNATSSWIAYCTHLEELIEDCAILDCNFSVWNGVDFPDGSWKEYQQLLRDQQRRKTRVAKDAFLRERQCEKRALEEAKAEAAIRRRKAQEKRARPRSQEFVDDSEYDSDLQLRPVRRSAAAKVVVRSPQTGTTSTTAGEKKPDTSPTEISPDTATTDVTLQLASQPAPVVQQEATDSPAASRHSTETPVSQPGHRQNQAGAR
jgi:hypothetical protein